MREAAVGAVDVPGGGDQRLFQRLATAQHGIEQAQRGTARRGAEGIGIIGLGTGQTCAT
jgi:hypothetical protein